MTNVVFVLPTLPPKSAQVEAIAQEINLLQRSFGGETIHVNPNAALPLSLIPRLGFGWHALPKLFRMASGAGLFHFFNPDPFPYPFLLALPKPVVYTITAGIEARPNLAYFRRMAVVTVPDERSLDRLRAWGLNNVALQRPGIASHRFTHQPLALSPGEPLRLLVASAPWSMAQFTTKGFDALLAAVQQSPDVQVTLLWRGLLVGEIRHRINALGINERVTVVDETVDVNDALGRVHAAAIFATASGIIKSYPHSLLDALAAGKPVLLNNTIPMSDYVNTVQCGVVINQVTPATMRAAFTELRARYDTLARHAIAAGQRDFTEAAALEVAAIIYAAAREKATRPGSTRP